jgi:hypothetical protein
MRSSTCGDTNGPRAANVVGDVEQRKEACQRKQKQDGWKQRQEKYDS